ncbi:MAG: ABC transporter ATP-binding protein [Xanthomonadales bacterium]|nr:ABC transporter ATP-binding protein [Xanthomonadales bacterium]
MKSVFEARKLTKRFNGKTVLDAIDLELKGPAIIGLLGRNGCGKTTLIRHMTGLYLPSEGTATTLGTPGANLGHDELLNMGFVPQEVQLLDWMTVEQQLEYVSSFYPAWDTGRQQKLLESLELLTDDLVGNLSSGNLQKLAIILAVCHHPKFLLLDEPVSDLDPIVRSKLLRFLLEVLQEDEATILISSHVLRDVEKIVDHVICIDEGKVTANAVLDDLKETLVEWVVNSPAGNLPEAFSEAFILEQEVSGRQARLVVQCEPGNLELFTASHGVEVAVRPLNLEDMFPWLVRGKWS